MNAVERKNPEDTRDRILDAAWVLFRQLGARATIADVAKELGMSSANVYRFYASRQALCEAVATRQLGALTDRAREIAAGPGSASGRVRATMLMMYAWMSEQMVSESRVHEIVDLAIAEQWPAIEAFKLECCATVIALIAEGQASGEFGPGDPELLGAQTLSACAIVHHPTMIAQHKCSPTSLPPEAIVEFALRALSNLKPATPPGG
jgi:AcrR family transcriptional regulator